MLAGRDFWPAGAFRLPTLALFEKISGVNGGYDVEFFLDALSRGPLSALLPVPPLNSEVEMASIVCHKGLDHMYRECFN